jgi:hypothetical protein
MKVKIKAIIRSGTFTANPGDIAMVDSVFGNALIKANAAELIKEPAAPVIEKAISVPEMEKAETVAQKPKPAPAVASKKTPASKSKSQNKKAPSKKR